MDNKFNRWTILKEVEPTIYQYKNKVTKRNFLCRCDCGTERVVVYTNLKRGLSKSCGCFNIESIVERNKTIKVKHNECNTPTYISHKSMLARCSNPNNPDYKNYGGRGIKVDKTFKTYNGFRKYLIDSRIGLRPSLEFSLDRIDSNKNYEPDNIRWSTMKQQQNNRRNNKINS
jgi:hypothetical protein